MLTAHEKHPQYADYLKTTSEPSDIGFDKYCFDIFFTEQDGLLKKYALRNEKFIRNHNYSELMVWLKKYLDTRPKQMVRSEMEDKLFNAHLTLSACHSSLMMELSNDMLDKWRARKLLEEIRKQKDILAN